MSEFGRAVTWGAGVYIGILLVAAFVVFGLPILLCTGMVGGCVLVGSAVQETAAKADAQRKPIEIAKPRRASPSSKVTRRRFDRVESGMTLDEVYTLLGDRCEVSADSELLGVRTTILTWYADLPSIGGNCNVTFQNGRVVMKAQAGLPLGTDEPDPLAAEETTPMPAIAGEPGDPIPLPELPAELFPDGDRPPPGPPPRIERPEPPAPELRDWTSADGRFSVPASFGGMAGGHVKLKKADGTEITVPLDSLSESDREWIDLRRRAGK